MIARTIVCPDCGGECSLVLPDDPEHPPEAGDVLAYRCRDCLDRWDVVVEEEDV